MGKEVIVKYSSDLKSDSTFYTDSNGRQMIKRVKDFRPTWNPILEESIAGNYYPVTNKIFLQEGETGERFSVLTDRSQGGSSLADGEVELMVSIQDQTFFHLST